MGEVSITKEESEIKKGDVVRILPPDEEGKNLATWGAQMNDTIGMFGEVKSTSGRFKLVVLQDSRQFYYINKHLKKAKRWQVKKYKRRVSKEVILLR